MSSNNAKAFRSGIWYTISNFIMRSIGLITTPIFTRMLSHEEFGLYNNYISWSAIFTIVITLYLESTFISARFDYEDDFDGYVYSSLILSAVVCSIFAVLLNILYPIMASKLGMSRVYMNSILVYLLFLPALNMFQARERYYYKYKISVLLGLVVSVTTALLSVVLVFVMDNRLDGRVYGTIIPTIPVGAVLYYVIYKRGKLINTSYWKYALKICLPYIPHLLSMTILNSVDRIMITNIRGPEENALYSLAYSCGAVITVLLVSMNTAFGPWLGEKLNEKKYEEIRKFSIKYIALFMGLAGAVMLLTPEIMLVLGGRTYTDAIYVMPPVACGCVFQFLYTMFVNVEQFSKNTIGMAVASASAALINYILNALLIPRYGYVAAAYTTLAGFAWLLIAHMFLVYKYGYKEVYPYRFVAAVAILALLFTAGVNCLYSLPMLRYTVLICYTCGTLTVIYKYRAEFMLLLKRED